MDELLSAYLDSNRPPEHLKRQPSYRQMLRVADLFDSWAQDARMSTSQSGKLMG